MILTKAQISRLLEELSYETVYEGNGLRVQRRGHGWSDDRETGALQAALSVMGEVETKMEEMFKNARTD